MSLPVSSVQDIKSEWKVYGTSIHNTRPNQENMDQGSYQQAKGNSEEHTVQSSMLQMGWSVYVTTISQAVHNAACMAG